MTSWAVEAGRYKHGMRAKYTLEGCRCFRCHVANTDYEWTRGRKKREGTWQPYATSAQAGEVLRHIERLQAAGIGVRQIARAAGIKRHTLREIIWPELRGRRGRPVRRRMRVRTAERILAVTNADRAGAAYVPGAKTWQRLEILLAVGYREAQLARMLGSRARHPALQLRKDRVLVRSAKRVALVFKELWLKDSRVRACAGQAQVVPVDWRLAIALS